MEPVLAIDFGTSNSAAAVLMPDGQVLVVEDAVPPSAAADAPRTKAFPTCVLYAEDGSEVAVGAAARAMAATCPDRLIHSVKPLLGKTYLKAEAGGELARLQVPVQPDAETGLCLFEIGERGIRPQEVCASVLRHIRTVAEAASGITFRDVVVSVPAYHDTGQIAALQESVHLAGFRDRVDIVREPVAAALALDMPITPRPLRALVLDLGGGTLDISASELCRVAPGPAGLQCRSLGNTGDNALGGLAFDDRLFEHLRRVFECGPLGPEDRDLLRRAAEAAKVRLSQALAAEVTVELGGRRFRHVLSRAELEAALRGGDRNLLDAIATQLRAALALAHWRPESVDLLALVGGPTAMPCIRQIAREVFYRNAAVLQQIDAADAVDPMSAVAVGGAKFRAAETVSRSPFGYGYVAVKAAPADKPDVLHITREAVTLVEPNTPYPSPLQTVIAEVAQYRCDNVVGIEIIEILPASEAELDAGRNRRYRFLGVRSLPVDDDSLGVMVQLGSRLNGIGEFELTLTSLLDGRTVTYVGTGGARRRPIELPVSRLEHRPPRHGNWVFVPDYAGGVRQFAEGLLARLESTPGSRRQDRHFEDALAHLTATVAASPLVVGTERQANDLYLAGLGLLARAQELRVLEEAEAATLHAALESARHACYRYDETELDITDA